MTGDFMEKPNNPLIQNCTADTLTFVSNAVAALYEHLGLLSESEEYPPCSAAYLGMSLNAKVIREAIDFEAERCPVCCPNCKEAEEEETACD